MTRPALAKDPYLNLILHVHPLRPITTDAEHQRAKKALRGLAGDKRAVAAELRKVLVGIIESYEREAGMRGFGDRRAAAQYYG